MSHKVNLVRVLTAATGNSTPITLGARYSTLFMTPAEAGAMDGRVYTYLIVDGNDFELGRGAYTASGTSLARTTVLYSRIAGTLGTSRITLSGTAQVRFVELSEDMDGMRGTRAVTGTSDTLNNSDLGYAVTYSNASAVAVSLAQASVSNLFLDGWAVWVKNKGAGAVTITPATSTIDGAATLVLAQNQGALIWSDGTNYQSFRMGSPVIGTTAGTVAAGDDARIIGSIKSVKKQVFTSSGTYTPSAGMAYAVIECLGGGGGGGGATSGANNGNAGGGGAGSSSRKYVTSADIGASKAVVVGAGGATSTAGNSTGNAGGDTSVGSLCIGKGGAGGSGSAGADNIRPGGAGGVAGTGDVTGYGASGLSGNGMNTVAFTGGAGQGASSPWGAGGIPNVSLSGAGGAATGYGAGGSGAASYNSGGSFSGGAGSPGLVIITEYCAQ